jgi:hypothetical protein
MFPSHAIPRYGHAGEGNLQATTVMNPEWSLEEWHERVSRILTDMFKLKKDLGGTLSGCTESATRGRSTCLWSWVSFTSA